MNQINKIYAKESDIQKAFIDLMEYSGGVVVKINNVGIRKANGSYIPPRQTGISDTIVCYKGYFIAVEFKTGTNKPTVYQQAFLDQVIAAGGIAFWSRDASEAFERVKAEVQNKREELHKLYEQG